MKDALAHAGSIGTTLWRWWRQELLGMVPARWLTGLGFPQSILTVEILDSVAEMQRCGRGITEEPWRCPLEGIPDGPTQLDHGFNPAEPVMVVLATEEILCRRVVLPTAARWRLRPILTLDLDRLSPLPPDRVVFDYRLLTADRPTNSLTVVVRLAKREVVEGKLALCRKLGLFPSAVIVSGDPLTDPPFLVLPPTSAPRRRRLWPWIVLVILLALLSEGVSLDQKNRAVMALDEELARNRAEALAVERIQTRITNTQRRLDFLPHRKHLLGPSLVLAEASRLLPDHSWVFEAEVTGQELRLHGSSPTAASLIGLFDGSPLFTNARFRAPLTQGAKSDLERFDLSVDIRGASP